MHDGHMAQLFSRKGKFLQDWDFKQTFLSHFTYQFEQKDLDSYVSLNGLEL